MNVLCTTDVLVVGGGPAGIGAAIGAARAGADVLLLERHAFFGGIAAFCLGMPINQMLPGGRSRSAVHDLVIDKLRAYGDRAVRVGDHQLWCNVEYLKVAVLDALDEAGCRYYLHAQVVDAVTDGDRVTGAVVATKQGLARIDAKVVVDCTGDADVAFFAGAETLKETGELSPMTLCLNVTNVDMDEAAKFAHGGGMRRVAEQAREKYPLVPERWGLGRFPSSNCFYINHSGTKGHGSLDGTDLADQTRAECISRRQGVQMTEAMREFGGAALKDVELIATGPQIGVRETRRVKGLYVLTEQDAKDGRRFDDAVAWRSGFLDIGFVRYERMKIHDVPYRAILPERVDGLLTAGRCISATHVAASAGKSMGNCVATGHAAGLAGAMAVATGVLPRELDVGKLRDALGADGVDLDRAGDEQEDLK
ncbi:hypothetical protein LCGC14_1538940 [marine sediment metagenome]|uniref:FAD-dependent oxidoreductase n=1 Tax=marine sediment metagenome TaxID=412755 RepID=A0A0F9JEL1_9ZZZZ